MLDATEKKIKDPAAIEALIWILGFGRQGSEPVSKALALDKQKESARGHLFQMKNLAVGKVAPEIEGEDVDGKKFKLSDYRGKVILLSEHAHDFQHWKKALCRFAQLILN